MKNFSPIDIPERWSVEFDGVPALYRLMGFVGHNGESLNAGHYTAIVKASWFCVSVSVFS